jgi:hypothetical protein
MMSNRVTGISEFVHHPVFWKLEKTPFRKLDLFPSSREEDTPLLSPLERANLSLVFRKADDGPSPKLQ